MNVYKTHQYGGVVILTDDQHRELKQLFEQINIKDQPDYETIESSINGNDKIIYNYDNYDELREKVNQMISYTTNELNNITENADDLLKQVELLNNTGLLNEDNENIGENKMHKKIYETIKAGTILFHPSQDVKRFNDAMIFVDINKVLDKSKQRSFSMFFTPNEEYARRYSGLWSLNKRQVYVHKLRVKQNIIGIKIIDASVIPDNMENLDLAKKMCGPTEDGTINGIKIQQYVKNNINNKIDEYYICNPELWFDFVETWMQFGSTEWIKITKDNIQTIQVPSNTEQVNTEQLNKEQVNTVYEDIKL